MMTGGCYCGALRYETVGKPVLKAQCHCRECQYLSGGGPNYFMLVAPDGFAYTSGTPEHFERDDLAEPVRREFCGTCGTGILTRRKDQAELVLKIGTLDDPSLFDAPRIAIFTCDAQSFHHVPDGIPAFERLPPRR
ncbi:MAG: GFA family protein [Pikeienuella sp.]